MATVGELARQYTSLSKEQTAHIVNLVGEWGMLADLCFADLMLHVPTADGARMIVGQVRAATGQTLYITDFVGTTYTDRKSTRLNSSHSQQSRMPSSA